MSRHIGILLALPVVGISQSVYAKDYLSVAQAQAALFPGADSFQASHLSLSKDQRKAIKKLSGVRQRWDEQKVWRAMAGDQTLGWFIVDDVVGKHEFITYAAAISPDGHVLGVEVMSYRETHGDEIMEADWRQNLVGKSLDDRFKLGDDVPNISGATLSCRNVTDGVHRLLALVEVMLSDG
ncbi:FMN-binding protein [Kordiimonas lipolytica]|uniref:FMN-binding protein n=1 Tax=Kordiimonas lipolytica TaxID=1662421 RepID=A0ABV8UH54_9PROT|nr:FMN-binding protein [Kordiimonas lipolytica]